ncbi:MAG TPA: hypothetical protein VM327_02230 [Candidatus Thermoplasmatota archaeon]|nr:hypothetical protein [Candidatus Thermoplasmatota archaeon]
MGRILIPACVVLLAILVAAPGATADICTKASGCEFWDSNYHEYILYKVDTAQVDVLIVPPASATTLWDVTAVRQSVAAWETGINAMGPSWLAGGLNIKSYVLGTDVPPASALEDPEIIIASGAVNPVVLFGIGLQTPFSVCRQQAAAAHQHMESDWLVQPMACQDGGAQCLVLNTNFLTGSTNRMYDLNAHEFGHCLGIGHVGDALDFDAKTVPLTDIMSYQNTPGQVHCVSSLNILALQAVYAPLLGQGAGQLPGTYVAQAPSSYTQTACGNPPLGLWANSAITVNAMQPVEALPLGLADATSASLWDPAIVLGDTPLGLF